MLKEVFAPHLGLNVKFGRIAPVTLGLRLRLGNYVDLSQLPPAPGSCDYTRSSMSSLVNVFLNDQLGDCVIAGGYHVTGVETGNAGNLFEATNQQIVADYSVIGGYKPGDPSTDRGCNEVTALNRWMTHGFANGTKLTGWFQIDASNKQEVQLAMWLFENLYFGVALPDEWIKPFPEKENFTWDVAGDADYDNGHCFIGAGYDSKGVVIDTWGLLGYITWDAIAKYCSNSQGGELYAMLSPDQIAKGQAKAPNGVAWQDIVADFNKLSGK